MDSKKKFQNLTIRDNFMFAAVMMEGDNCKHFLEMLLGIKIREVKVSYEKSLIYNPEYKGVRLDVYAADENNTRYDIEMQIVKQHLGKRARYYHSQMDMDLLESGHEYLKLPETYVIFICDFDPFGLEKYCYTFESRCLQEFSLGMGDFSRSIFLSTAGKDAEKIPQALKAFLNFVKQDTPDNNTTTADAYVRSLQKSIRRLKENRELERSFMTWDEIRQMAKEEGIAIGRSEGITIGRSEGITIGRSEGITIGRSEGITIGREEGIVQDRQEIILEHLAALGEIPEELRTRITSETDMDALKAMTTALFSAGSISEFEALISNLS